MLAFVMRLVLGHTRLTHLFSILLVDCHWTKWAFPVHLDILGMNAHKVLIAGFPSRWGFWQRNPSVMFGIMASKVLSDKLEGAG